MLIAILIIHFGNLPKEKITSDLNRDVNYWFSYFIGLLKVESWGQKYMDIIQKTIITIQLLCPFARQ